MDIIIKENMKMGNEKYFDESVILYDRFRPTYVKELFEDIISYSRITKSNKILENLDKENKQ